MWREIDIDLLTLSKLRSQARLPRVTERDVAIARDCGVRPVVVRPLAGSLPLRYEIVEGVKSWLVAGRAGMTKIAAEVRHELTDDEVLNLLEGEGGPHHNPIAESQAIVTTLDQEPGLQITELAARQGLPRTTVSQRLRLARLAPAVQQLLSEGRLKEGHARPLVTLPTADQVRLARRAIRENLSCRAVERIASDLRGATVPTARPSESAPRLSPSAKDSDHLRIERMISDHFACQTEFVDDGGRLTVVFHHHDVEVRDGILERLGARES